MYLILNFAFQSGSTGNPKGVVLTHFNLVNCLLSLIVIATHAVGKVRVREQEAVIAEQTNRSHQINNL
jgi:long-subunit acyl-CoA synthetase (AMP-forming)